MITKLIVHTLRAGVFAGICVFFPIGCAFFLVHSTQLHAEEASALPGIQMSVVGLGSLPPALFFQDEGKIVTIPLPKSGRGAEIRYKGLSPLVLFQETTDAQGKKIRVTKATVTYSPDWKKVLVVLISDGNPDDLFKAMAFDDSNEGFPSEHVRLFNFFPTKVAISADGGITQLEMGESQLLPFPTRDHYGRIWMKLAALRSGKWEILPIYITQIKANMRLLMFAYEQRTESGSMETIYRTITEIVPVDPNAKPKTVALR